jgi:hypothetical protein
VIFGAAHLHHLIMLVRARGYTLKQGLLAVGFQLTYTTLFGAYASFVFMRTGSLPAVVLCHTFCNVMGFPDLSWLSASSPLRPYKAGAPHVPSRTPTTTITITISSTITTTTTTITFTICNTTTTTTTITAVIGVAHLSGMVLFYTLLLPLTDSNTFQSYFTAAVS